MFEGQLGVTSLTTSPGPSSVVDLDPLISFIFPSGGSRENAAFGTLQHAASNFDDAHYRNLCLFQFAALDRFPGRLALPGPPFLWPSKRGV